MITFENPGLLDMRAVRTFGLSSKNASQIGRFGTGLKYAIATIIRGGGTVTIRSGGAEYKFLKEDRDFRSVGYQAILMNGEEMPFTTQLGRDWEPWMAFRELFANAKDEGGRTVDVEVYAEYDPEWTYISVDWNVFESIFMTIEEHFIPEDTKPIYAGQELRVYPGQSKFVFNNGIAVHELREPAQFRYDIVGWVSLTEDRTAKYSFEIEEKLANGIAACTSKEVLAKALCSESKVESVLDFSRSKMSEEAIGVVSRLGDKANSSAKMAVLAAMPKDPSKFQVIMKASQDSPAMSNLLKCLKCLKTMGADMSRFDVYLAFDIDMPSDYAFGPRQKDKATILLSKAVFENPDRMLRTLFKAYEAIVGKDWVLRKLAELAKKAAKVD